MIEQEVIGMEKQAAIDLIESKGLQSLILAEDGKNFMSTPGFKKNRINLYIHLGKVIKATVG